MKRLEAIQEAAYLSTGNTLQYRRIMRIFYREYEKMHFQLYEKRGAEPAACLSGV